MKLNFRRRFSRNSSVGWFLAAVAIAVFSSPTVRRILKKFAVRGSAMLLEMTNRLKQGTKSTKAPMIPVRDKIHYGNSTNTAVAKTDLPDSSLSSSEMFTVELSTPLENNEKREGT